MKNLCKKTLAVMSLFLCSFALFAKGSQEEAAAALMKNGPLYHYNVQIDYPIFDNEPELNSFLYAEVGKLYDTFMLNVKPLAGETFNMEFVVYPGSIFKNKEYISFLIYCYTYETGASHGSTAIIPVNYDVQEKKLISIDEYLRPMTTDWLSKVSEEARRQLMEKGKRSQLTDGEWIKKGTTLDPENFKNFQIGKKGVTIVFNQYQVAPYAAGMPDILIPFKFFEAQK